MRVLVIGLVSMTLAFAFNELWWFRNSMACSDGPFASRECRRMWTHPSVAGALSIRAHKPHDHFWGLVRSRPWIVQYVDCRSAGGDYDSCAGRAQAEAAQAALESLLSADPANLDPEGRLALEKAVSVVEALSERQT